MNYKGKNWQDRLSLICSIDDEVEDSGGGGEEQVSDETLAEADESAIDLSSEDPDVIVQFPKNHKLTDSQMQALLGIGAKNKKQTDPTVAKPEDKAPKPAPAKKAEKAPAVDPKAPVWDEKVKRWRDPVSKAIVATPKDPKTGKPVNPPKPVQAQTPAPKQEPPKPAEKPLAQQIAEGVAQALNQNKEPPPEDNKPEAPKPFYGALAPALAVPDQVLALIDSDDPGERKTGMGHLINGVANVIMRDVTQAFPHLIKAAVEQSTAQFGQRQAAGKNASSFYEQFPQLNNEYLWDSVDAFGQKLAQEWAAQGQAVKGPNGQMTPEFMKAVATGFAAAAGISLQSPEGSGQQEEEVVVEPKKQPFFSRGKARPPAATSDQVKSADIMSVVGFR